MLSIAPAKVCQIIAKARPLDAKTEFERCEALNEAHRAQGRSRADYVANGLPEFGHGCD
jgi:hypothetical protein